MVRVENAKELALLAQEVGAEVAEEKEPEAGGVVTGSDSLADGLRLVAEKAEEYEDKGQEVGP